ncbi:MAG: acetyl-CoA hydrolase, partial [Woeseiaceae bacterium]|nr:acetyl-CoA hydrolase [Woeseiaceae bacterium]
LNNSGLDFEPFALPNRSVSSADYATAMHVASLVPDGGTLQVGIGSLSDAVAHCLKLRNTFPDIFAKVYALLPGGSGSKRRGALPTETGPFDEGLFASTELMSDALFALFEAGIIKRNADDEDHAAIHAGFFIGSGNLYESLRSLSDADLQRINMTNISRVNTLFGDEVKKRRQRRQARFVNETMMVTLLGAAVSDALEDGRVVSGVGGQFDFVSMALQLDDAQSILMCRARRMGDGVAQSNIRWSYGHNTVPRHYRDVYVSEYGVAATRGRTDEQVVDAMLGIADAAFQPELMRQAGQAGKLAADYELPSDGPPNTPATIDEIFQRRDLQAYFPAYPLGTELTVEEQSLAAALQWLKAETATPANRVGTALAALLSGGDGSQKKALARMALDKGMGPKQVFLRRLVGYALKKTAVKKSPLR